MKTPFEIPNASDIGLTPVFSTPYSWLYPTPIRIPSLRLRIASVVRLRAINAGAMSHVVLRFPPFATVYIVSVDGVATQPQLGTSGWWSE